MLLITGLLTRLPLILLFLIPRDEAAMMGQSGWHYLFLFVFLVYFFGNIIIYPAINVLLKTNYRHEHFGKLYSYATSINKIVMLLVTFVYGYLLDFNNFSFVYIIPLIGVLGVISVFILSNIKYPENEPTEYHLSIYQSVKRSILEMKHILSTNIPYKHFEMGFMFYGFSFMISVTVITIYFYEHLDCILDFVLAAL